MEIKVLRRPIGEAPDWVRDAWIGLSLPLAMERKRDWVGLGVLSGPINVLSQICAVLRGKGSKVTGYAVNAKTAVDLLAEVQPEAAQWWRENTPRLLTDSRRFIFDAAACEPVQVKE